MKPQYRTPAIVLINALSIGVVVAFNHAMRVTTFAPMAALFVAACLPSQPQNQHADASISGAGSVNALRMIDVNAGWAYGPYRLERTTDGAHVFTDVTPPGVDAKHAIRSHEFLDAKRAWVLIGPIATGASQTLERTSDGGATWTAVTTLSSDGSSQIGFVDPFHGWLVVNKWLPDCVASNTACGPPTGRQTTLKRTSDGGATWTVTYRTTQQFTGSSLVKVTLPGIPGLSLQPIADCGWWGPQPQFISAQVGFVGLSCPGAVQPVIAATADGGHTWRHITLPAPADNRGAVLLTSVDRIHFFSVRDGVAFVSRCTGDGTSCVPSGAMLYTHDGGVSWSVGAPVHGWGLAMDAVDTTHAWLPDASLTEAQPSSLLVTSDSGVSWEALKLPTYLIFPQGGSRAFQFVTPSRGFAWIWTTSAPDPKFYRTDDGGRSFEELIPRLS
jgi:hypothetical protein